MPTSGCLKKQYDALFWQIIQAPPVKSLLSPLSNLLEINKPLGRLNRGCTVPSSLCYRDYSSNAAYSPNSANSAQSANSQ